MRISETFVSIQGESTRAGLPTLFIRTTGCNLRCAWCDTTHAYQGGEERSLDDLVALALSSGVEAVTLTGGEPLLHPDAPELIRRLLDAGLNVQVETNGSIDIGLVDPRARRIVDIKAPGSGEAEKFCIDNLARLEDHDELKLVLRDRQDYEWARELIRAERLHELATVLLYPVHGVLAPAELAAWILEDRLGVRMGMQLHKLIWGEDARGV